MGANARNTPPSPDIYAFSRGWFTSPEDPTLDTIPLGLVCEARPQQGPNLTVARGQLPDQPLEKAFGPARQASDGLALCCERAPCPRNECPLGLVPCRRGRNQ